MKSVKLKFYHPDFDLLSDRSVRQFLKKVGTEVRDAQLSQARDFVLSLDLEYRYQQSILDRLTNASESVPAYFVERIRRGSLEAVFIISAGVIGPMVFGTVLQALDDVDRESTLKRLRKFMRKRWNSGLVEDVIDRLSDRELVNHVVVDDVKVIEKKSGTVIDVTLTTVDDEGDRVRPDYTLDGVDREIGRRLDELRSTRGGVQE